MSFQLGKRRLTSLAAILAGALLSVGAGRAGAQPCDSFDPFPHSQVTIDQAGAVLVFPKVVFTSGRDTIIQISNVWNYPVIAHCFYNDGRPMDPSQPADPNRNPAICQETDFTITLTRQQPTHWVASFGRQVDPSDLIGGQNSGYDPGAIPPVSPGFEGELICVAVEASGSPTGTNWLKGEATIRRADGDVSNYNAIAIRAGDMAGATGNTLILDEVGKDTTGEYNSCPNTLLFDYVAFGQPDPIIKGLGGPCAGDNCPIDTTLTLVPCSVDFENPIPGRSVVNFSITNEFEEILSASTTVQCWFNSPLDLIGSGGLPLSNPFVAGVLGSPTGLARVTPASGQGGVLGLAEETHSTSTPNSARAAFNLQHEGSRACNLTTDNQDRIVLPASPF